MYPIIATTVMGIIMMFSGILFKEKKGLATLASILLAILLGINLYQLFSLPKSAGESLSLFNNMLVVDRYSQWFNVLITGCTLLFVILMGRDISKVGGYISEYFALIFFILCGIYLLSGYNTLLILFIGIEIMSIPQYILAGSDKRNLKSSEASLKYFLMGSFTTGILLMGIALIYGATGAFNINDIATILTTRFSSMALAGIIFILIAFGFKVSAAPMHLWTADVYDGSPTPFTAYMSTVVKAAAFFGFLRLFHTTFGAQNPQWMLVLAVVTAATLLVGNITAVFQQSVKRMLAYSSIAQAGFMLFAILSINAIAWQGIIVYSVAYTVASMGMFAVILKLKDYTYDGFNGLAKKEPFLALVTTIFICSLAGIPLTGGFIAKYYMLYALMQQGNMMWLVIFGLLMAAISAYYYFRVIMAMYFKQGNAELHQPVSETDKVVLAITAIIVILIGITPQILLQVVSK